MLFLDAGNVWAESWGFDLDDLRYAIGPGLRYQTPIGPIRFDFGYQLNPIPGSARERQPADAALAPSLQHRAGVLTGEGLRVQGAGMSIVKRVAHVLIIVLTLVVGATAAAVIVSQTAWFKNWLRGYIVREAKQYLNGTLSIERLGGNLFFGVEMENIGVSMDGSQVVAVKDLGLDYNVFELLTKGLSVDSIRLDKPVIYLRRDGDTWSLSRLVKKQETEADRSGPAKPIAIDAIGITDGSVVVESPVGTSGVELPKRFDHLDAKLSFKYEPVRYSIEITHVSFRGSEPALALNALSGGIAVKDDTVFVEKLALRTSETSLSVDGAVQHYLTRPVFNLQISSDKLSLPEIAQLVPALAGIRLQPSFNVKADGPLDRLGVEMNVQSSAGHGERQDGRRSRWRPGSRCRAICRCSISICRRC